ncbi:MAG: TIGR02996 domain-containing protein [Planctomycetota bacterium]
MSARDESDFIAAINAAPDDDVPRLVFADWIAEKGDAARAEFIRLQLQRQALPTWDPQQLPLYVREQKLLELHESEWRSALPTIDGVAWGTFRRGFISSATITNLEGFSSLIHQCRRSAPIDSVTINWPDPNGHFDDPLPIDGLRELTLNDTPYLDTEQINVIAWSPVLVTIEKLHFGPCNLSADGIHTLLQSSHLGQLKSLDVSSNSIGNNGLEAIIGSLTSLEALDVSEQESYSRYEEDPVIDESGIMSLVDWPGFRTLRSLNLSGNTIGSSGLHALLQTENCTGLKCLCLRDTDLSGASMEAFERAHGDLRLETLDLGENYLSNVGAGFLAHSNCLGELKTLNLDRCELDGMSGGRLADSPLFYSIRKLNLNDNPLGAAGLSAILEREPEHLHTLQAANIDRFAELVAYIAYSNATQNLQALDLSSNGLGKEAIETLCEAGNFPNLLVLGLNHNFSTALMEKLMQSPLWNQLVNVESSDDGIPFERER